MRDDNLMQFFQLGQGYDMTTLLYEVDRLSLRTDDTLTFDNAM